MRHQGRSARPAARTAFEQLTRTRHPRSDRPERPPVTNIPNAIPADHNDPHKYLDPVALAKVRSLEIQARLIVEGFLSGMHKSPYHGFSVEFAQHREYVPGDDLKHLDWKVYSRTGRFYLKQYEEETNLTLWVLVDASESMRYGSGVHGS